MANEYRPPLVHIGYHKCASTWLQKAFFPQHPQLCFALGHGRLMPELIRPDGFDFQPGPVREAFREAMAGCQDRIPVASSERLSGNPHSGGYDAAVLAERIGRCFDRPRILIVVRRQADMLVSCYKQYVKMGGIARLEDYLQPPVGANDGRLPLFRLRNFEYDRLVADYQERFGADSVLVLPYEQLRAQPHAFVAELCGFLGVAVPETPPTADIHNPAWPARALALKRRLNWLHGADSLHPVTPPWPRLTRALFRWLERHPGRWASPGAERRLREGVRGIIGDHYGPSNQRLNALVGGRLTGYGYLPGEAAD
jgi:hypothetical protein